MKKYGRVGLLESRERDFEERVRGIGKKCRSAHENHDDDDCQNRCLQRKDLNQPRLLPERKSRCERRCDAMFRNCRRSRQDRVRQRRKKRTGAKGVRTGDVYQKSGSLRCDCRFFVTDALQGNRKTVRNSVRNQKSGRCPDFFHCRLPKKESHRSMRKRHHAGDGGNGDLGRERGFSQNEHFRACDKAREGAIVGGTGCCRHVIAEGGNPFRSCGTRCGTDDFFGTCLVVLEIRQKTEEELLIHEISGSNLIVRHETRTVTHGMKDEEATNSQDENVHCESLKEYGRNRGKTHLVDRIESGGAN